MYPDTQERFMHCKVTNQHKPWIIAKAYESSPRTIIDIVSRIRKGNPLDMEVLEKWEDYFKSLDVAFITTISVGGYTIHKIKKA